MVGVYEMVMVFQRTHGRLINLRTEIVLKLRPSYIHFRRGHYGSMILSLSSLNVNANPLLDATSGGRQDPLRLRAREQKYPLGGLWNGKGT